MECVDTDESVRSPPPSPAPTNKVRRIKRISSSDSDDDDTLLPPPPPPTAQQSEEIEKSSEENGGGVLAENGGNDKNKQEEREKMIVGEMESSPPKHNGLPPPPKKSILAELCDSDSAPEEDDDDDDGGSKMGNNDVPPPPPPEVSRSRKSGPTKRNLDKAAGTRKMTGKEALEQRHEIRSESQRMIRESRVSLPYHKPKLTSQTLREFLERRSKLTSLFPASVVREAPASIAIKMSKDQLEIVSNNLNKRIKEVEELYKSDDDDDDIDDDDDLSPDNGRTSTVDWIGGLLHALVDNVIDKVEGHDKDASSLNQQIEITRTTTENDDMVITTADDDDKIDGVALAAAADDDSVQSIQISKKPSNLFDDLILSDVQPKLSGNVGDLIDLDSNSNDNDDEEGKSEVERLVERFIRNTTGNKGNSSMHHHQPQHKVKINVVSVSGGEIHNETVAMTVDDVDLQQTTDDDVPGAKMRKFRENLRTQLAQLRTESWQQKQKLGTMSSSLLATDRNKLKVDNISNCCDGDAGAAATTSDFDDDDDGILDDENEEDMELSDSTSYDEEIDDEEEDEKKCREKKSVFLDNEAADEEDCDVDDDGDGNEADIDDEDEEDDDEEDNEEIEDLEVSTNPKQKSFKRILTHDDDLDDDDDDHDDDADNQQLVIVTKTVHKELETPANVDDDDDDDDMLPPNLPRVITNKTPLKPQTVKSDFDFLTPVSYLTGLQNLNSDSKMLRDSPSPAPIISPFRMESVVTTTEPLTITENPSQSNCQKQLTFETTTTTTTTALENIRSGADYDSLADLCSGQFPTTVPQVEINSTARTTTTQDLIDICSGTFTGLQQSTKPIDRINSDDANRKEFKSLDHDQDLMISQLLIDEEELMKFKKKFESPVLLKSDDLSQFDKDEVGEIKGTGVIVDTDDETTNPLIEVRRTKKKTRKLDFSDEDSSDDDDSLVEENGENNEEIDLHDENIEYDSEENEVVVPTKQQIKLSDFVENEAELSESEWGSADEDEKDLDTMELELGDSEKFDENKIRRDIEKIHMRKMLDEDTHQVKLLQELLLDDGELHGTGRQRQFKWRNINSVDSDLTSDVNNDDDGDMYLDEEESEEQWRKNRYQREMFLKEQRSQQKHNDVDDVLDSILGKERKLFRIEHVSQGISQKSLGGGGNNVTGAAAAASSSNDDQPPIIKQTFNNNLLTKRGSFLSRGDQVLQRLAKFTSKVSSTGSIGGAGKTTKNFIFQTISSESSSSKVTSLIEQKKRKATLEGTPNAIKKLRLTNLSPAVVGANKKQLDKPERAKKLFGNW